MTIITMQLDNDLVKQARQVGVLNEQALADLCSQFLQTHIDLMKKNFTPSSKSLEQQVEHTNTESECLSITDIAGSLQNKTTVTATVEEMNESIAHMFKNWEG